MFSKEDHSLSPTAYALIEAGQSVIHITGAVAGMLVSVSCQDRYGSGVIQAWPEVAPLVNRIVRETVIGFMRDVVESDTTAPDLAAVTADYYGLDLPNRMVIAQLTEWALAVMGVGEPEPVHN